MFLSVLKNIKWLTCFTGVVLFLLAHVTEANSLSANPNPCQLVQGQTSCDSTISWSSSNNSACTFRANGTKLGCGGSSSVVKPFSNGSRIYLKNGSSFNDSTLARITIYTKAYQPQSGSISASPNPCLLAPGASTCNATISWRAAHARQACIFRANQTKLACGFIGSITKSFSNGSIVYLKAGSAFSAPTLASVQVRTQAPVPTGSLSTSFNPCTILYGRKTCDVEVSWSASTSNVCIFRANGIRLGCGSSGRITKNFSSGSKIYLKAGNSFKDLTLDSETIIGIAEQPSAGNISALPNPCVIVEGQSMCVSTLSWQTSNAEQACVFRANHSKLACGKNGSISAVFSNGSSVYLKNGDSLSDDTLAKLVLNVFRPPIGNVEIVSNGVFSGWVKDNDAPNLSINLRILIDGIEVDNIVANQVHQQQGTHGFDYQVDKIYRDNTDHQIKIVAIDQTPGLNPQFDRDFIVYEQSFKLGTLIDTPVLSESCQATVDRFQLNVINDFGANSTNGLDDTESMRGALDCIRDRSFNEAENFELYFPAGVYTFNTQRGVLLSDKYGNFRSIKISGAGL